MTEYLTTTEVLAKLKEAGMGVQRRALYYRIEFGNFPEPMRPAGTNKLLFKSAEVRQFIDGKWISKEKRFPLLTK